MARVGKDVRSALVKIAVEAAVNWIVENKDEIVDTTTGLHDAATEVVAEWMEDWADIL